MKTFTFLFLAILLAINSLFAQAPQESPELKQATVLTDDAVKLFKEGKYDDALSRAKRALEIREKLLPHTGPEDVSLAGTLDRLAVLYARDGSEVKALHPKFE